MRIPIIGVGGIDSSLAAREKMVAGADLIQISTSFIYKGPKSLRISWNASDIAVPSGNARSVSGQSGISCGSFLLAAARSVAGSRGKRK